MHELARKEKRKKKITVGAEERAGGLSRGVMLLGLMVFLSDGTSPALCSGCELMFLTEQQSCSAGTCNCTSQNFSRSYRLRLSACSGGVALCSFKLVAQIEVEEEL